MPFQTASTEIQVANETILRRFAEAHGSCREAQSARTLLSLPYSRGQLEPVRRGVDIGLERDPGVKFAAIIQELPRVIRGESNRSLRSWGQEAFDVGIFGALFDDVPIMEMARDLRVANGGGSAFEQAVADLGVARYLVRIGAHGLAMEALQTTERRLHDAGPPHAEDVAFMELLYYRAFRGVGERELALDRLDRAIAIADRRARENEPLSSGNDIRQAAFLEAAVDRDYAAMDQAAPYFLNNTFEQEFFAAEIAVWARHDVLARRILRSLEDYYDPDGANPLQRRGAINCLRAMIEPNVARAVEIHASCTSTYPFGDAIVYNSNLERLGDWASAEALFMRGVQGAESRRSTLPVRDRIAYFNSRTREWYWGVTRVSARLAAAHPNDREAFAHAVAQSDRIRSRQLSEARRETYTPLTAADVSAVMDNLVSSDAVIGMTMMTDHLVIWGFSREASHIAVLDIGRADLEARIANIVAGLSSPNTDAAALQAQLLLLSNDVLSPVLPLLAGKNRVIFILDGALHRIPPALLSVDSGRYRPLLEQAEVITTPALRQASSASPFRRGAALIAFGDPDYQSLSLRAEIAPASPQRGNALIRAGNAFSLAQLPETRVEVEQISASTAAGASRIFLGEDASETAFKSLNGGEAAYLHIATHGLLAGEIPGLSEPSLLLTPDQRNDGRLTLSEVEALRLDTYVTVLSACNTGSGRLSDGEGVLGMSRAFLVAGSRNVVMSLWPVDSEVTVDLMDAFYTGLAAGSGVSAALRGAAIDIRAAYPHPYYWAPFSLISRAPLSAEQ